jgi:hypothetical protein
MAVDPGVLALKGKGSGRAMAQAVSRRPLTAEVRVRSLVTQCVIYAKQSSTGTGFPPEYFGFPLSVLFR